MSFKDQSADISMLRELNRENSDFNRQISSPGDLSLFIDNKHEMDFKKEPQSPMLNS